MTMPGTPSATPSSDFTKGAQDPVVHPQQKGHEEMGGQQNSASTGRNDPTPSTYPLTGTPLPAAETTSGNVMRGGRRVRG